MIPALNEMNLLYLPTTMDLIEDVAFYGIPAEAMINPDGCRPIGSRAFAGCENLLYVKISVSATQIASDAFDECPKVIIDKSVK